YGTLPDLHRLDTLTFVDFRHWLAYRKAQRRMPASTNRALSTLRNFLGWLECQGLVRNAYFAQLNSLRLLTQPPQEAKATADTVDQTVTMEGSAWVQTRDAAILTLIYGAGLRIDETLWLNRDILPLGESLRVTATGNRERIVPMFDFVRE